MDSKKNMSARGRKSAQLGVRKMIAGMKIARAVKLNGKADGLAARNAYRAAIGLPLIEPGKPLVTKEHNSN